MNSCTDFHITEEIDGDYFCIKCGLVNKHMPRRPPGGAEIPNYCGIWTRVGQKHPQPPRSSKPPKKTRRRKAFEKARNIVHGELVIIWREMGYLD